MFKDLDIKFKNLPWALCTLAVAVLSILYFQINKDFFEGIFGVFSLSVSDVQGIIAFTVLFFVIIQLVSNSLVKPYVALNQKREELNTGRIQEANMFLEEAQKLEDAFHKKASVETRKALTQKAVILTEARRNAEDIIFQTENEVSSEVASAKERIDLRSKIMLNELVIKKQEFLGLIKEKILNP